MASAISKSILWITLIGVLSCSQKKRMTHPEASPASTETVKQKQEAEQTLCGSKINRPHYHLVEINQMKFNPEILNVHRGDTVVWVNCDIVTHDVTEEKNKRWQSSPLAPTHSWQKIVTESADYYCSIHVVMKGKLSVM